MEKLQIINNTNFAIKEIIMPQWSSPDDYWYVSIIQRKKDNDKVLDRNGKSIFVRGSEKWIDGDFEDNRIGYAIINGNSVKDAINSLLDAKVVIFDSWIDFVGQKIIQGNDSIASVCRAFNARAYISIYKRSMEKFSSKELPNDIWTPKILRQELIGKNDPSSRERVFDFVSTRKPRKNLPVWLIDCDDEDEEVNRKIFEYITKNCGVEPKMYRTYNGFHYLVDMSHMQNDVAAMKKIKDDLNIFIHNSIYDGETDFFNKRQRNPIEIEDDKKIILYSEVGIEGNNAAHPKWQTRMDYPVPELRSSKIKQLSTVKKKPVIKNKKTFVIPLAKGGVFKCDGSSQDLVINALRNKFPNWPEKNIIKLSENPNYYIMENIDKIFRKVLNEFIKRESVLISENFNDEAFKRTDPIYYSGDDKLSLVKDPYDSLDKSQQHGNMRNFAIRRNGKVYWVARSMAVQCCVFCKDQQGEWCLLASKRGGTGDRSGQWNIVGGFLDYGENLEMAVARECLEETGVEIPKESVKYIGHHAPVGDGPVDIFFKAILNGTTDMYNAPTLANCEGYGTAKQESTDVGWIPVSQLENYNFVSRQRKYIQQLVSELSAGDSGNELYTNFANSLNSLLKNGMINNNIYNKIIKLVNIN